MSRATKSWVLEKTWSSNKLFWDSTSFLKPILVDLVQELVGSDNQGWVAIAIYEQGVDILEYEALMVLEHVFPVLQSMFSDLQPIIELTQRGESKI